MAIVEVDKTYIVLKNKEGGHIFWTTSGGGYDSDTYELLFSSDLLEECIAAWRTAFILSILNSI